MHSWGNQYFQQQPQKNTGQWWGQAHSLNGRPQTPTRQGVTGPGSAVEAQGIPRMRPSSPAPNASQRPPVAPQAPGVQGYHINCAVSWQTSQGGQARPTERYSSPSPGVRSAENVKVADSQALQRAGYTSPAPRQSPPPSPARRAPSPHHYQASARGRLPMRILGVELPPSSAQRPKSTPISNTTHRASSPGFLAQPSLAQHPAFEQRPVTQDQIAHYKSQVQELKHAIQAHASSMGVEVSSIMDRCVTESNSSSDCVLLQVRMLLPC